MCSPAETDPTEIRLDPGAEDLADWGALSGSPAPPTSSLSMRGESSWYIVVRASVSAHPPMSARVGGAWKSPSRSMLLLWRFRVWKEPCL